MRVYIPDRISNPGLMLARGFSPLHPRREFSMNEFQRRFYGCFLTDELAPPPRMADVRPFSQDDPRSPVMDLQRGAVMNVSVAYALRLSGILFLLEGFRRLGIRSMNM